MVRRAGIRAFAGPFCVFGVKGYNLFHTDLNSGATQQLTFGQSLFLPACSPDGQWVAYLSGDCKVFKIAIQGGTPQKVSELVGVHPAFSPDGKLIAFAYFRGSGEDSHVRIAVIPAAGGAPLYIFEADPRFPVFSSARIQFTRDGKGLVHTLYDGGADNLWVQPLPGGPLQQLTFFKSLRIGDFAFSPDGKSIALLRGQDTKDVVLIKARESLNGLGFP